MKSLATPGTLAHVAVCKFEDALPLYRQEKIFERLGIDIPRATMARWMIACGTLVRPLIEKIRLEILAGQVVHMDETPIQVLKEKGRNPWDKSYMWVMARGSPRGGPRAVIYSYHISRSQIVVEDLLRGYAGHVQSDEFSGYNLLDRRGGITRIGCWAHVRRQFTDALKTNPRGGSGTVANEIITKIKFLYDFERDIKDLSPEEVVAARRARSLPVLANLKNLEEEYSTQIPPKSATGKALTYMRNAWSHLTTYVDCGYADIDNNYVERAIRPFTTGRKNWLFADTPAGAHASAALYSLVETAKANKIDPYQYLKRVFTELPQIAEGDSIDHLLPWNLISETLN
jgi:transposase